MSYKMENMKSTLKTTAAVLRSIIGGAKGLKDSVWAEMLGKSVYTIRHLEAGSLKLSAALAAKMNYETGISIKWLMDGNPDAPPIDVFGEKYTKAIYDEVQAQKKYFAHVEENNVKINALEFLRTICNILIKANRKNNYHLTAYRIWKALNELTAEFGEARDFNTYEKVLTYVQDVWHRKEPGLPLVPLPEQARNIQEGLRKLAQANPQLIENNPTASKRKSKQPLKKKKRRRK
jgi:hypothetical protein